LFYVSRSQMTGARGGGVYAVYHVTHNLYSQKRLKGGSPPAPPEFESPDVSVSRFSVTCEWLVWFSDYGIRNTDTAHTPLARGRRLSVSRHSVSRRQSLSLTVAWGYLGGFSGFSGFSTVGSPRTAGVTDNPRPPPLSGEPPIGLGGHWGHK
jgi:hypothetical protein